MNDKDGKKRILFICTHNSARSQIAEGLMNSLFGEKYAAFSAGTNPSEVNPHAIKVMSEIDIDITEHKAKGLDEFVQQDFDYVITVCDQANESCPYFPGGKERIHKGFKDPAAVRENDIAKHAVFRQVRDEIREWLIEKFG